jgi:nucleoside phosphorylase
MNVDFLIVAALKDEAREIMGLLSSPGQEGAYVVGNVRRWKNRGEYCVAILNLHDGMGAHHAGPVTQEAISQLRPCAVLMTGIAAGFEDSRAKVALGDLMIPFGIVPYELAKIEAAKDEDDGGVQHRAIAWAVSEVLWRTAAETAGDAEQPWLTRTKLHRPDGGNGPRIHVFADSVLGCGEKVVADHEAEARQWLIETYPRQILGLEMESFAAFRACRILDVPFLVAKASVDKATIEKDDRWREYACKLSADFLFEVVRRYDRPRGDLLVRHLRECVEVKEALEANLRTDDFQYKIRKSLSFQQLRQGIFDGPDRDRGFLIPSDLHPATVLYAGGGAGKTTVVRRLFAEALNADVIPLIVDLKRYSSEQVAREAQPNHGPKGLEQRLLGALEQCGVGRLLLAAIGATKTVPEPPHDDEGIEALILKSTLPRRTADEVHQLASQGRLILFIDGANEVSKSAIGTLLSFCRGLRHTTGALMLWTNRMTALEGVWPDPLHATLSHIPIEVAAQCFDDKFGQGKFEALSDRLQRIFQRPFFLDLAIRSERPFSANRLWSGIFREFFREHLTVTPEELDKIARATLDALGADGKLRLDRLKGEVGPASWEKLAAAEVGVVNDTVGFGHHLWKDYLVSRALNNDRALWTDEVFDAATTFGTSVECLSMAVEQIGTAEDKLAFVNAVYDWSYSAALECAAMSGDDEEAERRLPATIREAIVAVVAEKRFDRVERTRRRTESLLAQYAIARPYRDASGRDKMVERVAHLAADDESLLTWKRLYCHDTHAVPSEDDIALIASPLSLVGWTAANLARRAQLAERQVARICAIYRDAVPSADSRSVRWRAVHALGAHPCEASLQLLSDALANDRYRWVAYGAARSMVELASRFEGRERARAVEALKQFVDGDRGESARPLILEEIIETCFIDGAAPGWPAHALPLMDHVLSRSAPDLRPKLETRVKAFRIQANVTGSRRPGPPVDLGVASSGRTQAN